ncbi:MAG: hypothetical protein ACN4GZ_06230 [Acidimicrobiales bacterium]
MSSEKYLFLSDEWIAKVTELRAEVEQRFSGQLPEPPAEVRLNVTVTQIPHRDDLHGHVDTTGGSFVILEGALEEFDVAVTTDYLTAAEFFASSSPEEFMQALMPAIFGGHILIEGDLAELMPLMQQQVGSPAEIPSEARDVGARIAAFTEI